ncbi:hypothetical protein PG993_011856 [Apiospora rasikravindrae]|uniref:Uncharacterized protein n=1 Tax=Apiospora rasikravindrae TaxID=990691 RepID=A0ABR1S0S9_9PEZI
MFRGTMCRLPTVVRPATCTNQLYDNNFDVGALFLAASSSSSPVGEFYGRACESEGDREGDTKLLHHLFGFNRHDKWILPDEDDKGKKDFYYHLSQTNVLLREEVRRSVSSRETVANLNDMCMVIREGRQEGRQTYRDLARALYDTTGLWARLKHRMYISIIDETRVNALATAFLARRDKTFEAWAAMRRQIRRTLDSMEHLERRNAQIGKTAARAQDKMESDMKFLAVLDIENLTEPVATFRVWDLLRHPSRFVRDAAAVTREEIDNLGESLEHVQHTAEWGQKGMDDIRSLLDDFDGKLEKLEGNFDWMKPLDRQTLLEDWRQHEGRIALKGSDWCQILFRRYGFKTWASIFFMDDQWKFGDLSVLLQMAFEPILILLLLVYLNPMPDDGLLHYPLMCFGWLGIFALFGFFVDVVGVMTQKSFWDSLYFFSLVWEAL